MNIEWEKLIQTEGPNPYATEQDQNNDLCVKSKRGMKATLGQRQNEGKTSDTTRYENQFFYCNRTRFIAGSLWSPSFLPHLIIGIEK
jgi:hypothetical protein